MDDFELAVRKIRSPKGRKRIQHERAAYLALMSKGYSTSEACRIVSYRPLFTLPSTIGGQDRGPVRMAWPSDPESTPTRWRCPCPHEQSEFPARLALPSAGPCSPHQDLHRLRPGQSVGAIFHAEGDPRMLTALTTTGPRPRTWRHPVHRGGGAARQARRPAPSGPIHRIPRPRHRPVLLRLACHVLDDTLDEGARSALIV